jgi:hypothetical protein
MNRDRTIETAAIEPRTAMKLPGCTTRHFPEDVKTENSTRGTVFCAVFRTADLGN